MDPLRSVTSRAVALLLPDVDTDVITPMKRLTGPNPHPLAHYAFEPLRYTGGDADTGAPDPSFPLNRPGAAGAEILLVGDNFGCGSSRESAPAALAALGFRCLIGPSFGSIFASNCFQIGLLPVVADRAVVEDLAAVDGPLTVDLELQQIVWPPGLSVSFECDPYHRAALLDGLDGIEVTLRRRAAIDEFTDRDRLDRPWIHRLP